MAGKEKIVGSGQIAWGVTDTNGDQSVTTTKTSDRAELRDKTGNVVAVCFHNIRETGTYEVALTDKSSINVGDSFGVGVVTDVSRNEGNTAFTTYTITVDYGGAIS